MLCWTSWIRFCGPIGTASGAARSIPGAISWLTYMKDQFGPKPDEQTMIKLLRKEKVKLFLHEKPSCISIIATQAPHRLQVPDRMFGIDLPDFHCLSKTVGVSFALSRRNF